MFNAGFLYRGRIAIDLGQSQMVSRLADDFPLVLQDNTVVSRNLNSITTSWVTRHMASTTLRKGFPPRELVLILS